MLLNTFFYVFLPVRPSVSNFLDCIVQLWDASGVPWRRDRELRSTQTIALPHWVIRSRSPFPCLLCLEKAWGRLGWVKGHRCCLFLAVFFGCVTGVSCHCKAFQHVSKPLWQCRALGSLGFGLDWVDSRVGLSGQLVIANGFWVWGGRGVGLAAGRSARKRRTYFQEFR